MPKSRQRIAVICSPLILRQLTPGLEKAVSADWEFQPMGRHWPPSQLLATIGRDQPDAILLEYDADLVETLFSCGKPMVVLFADLLIEGAACINVDDFRIGWMAAEYFRNRGLRHFAYYGKTALHAPERRSGFSACLEQFGHNAAYFEENPADEPHSDHWNPPSAALINWLERLPRPCAVLAAHDAMGRTLVEACRQLGISIPDEIAILSASDDETICKLAYPPLSSIEMPWTAISHKSVEALKNIFAGKKPLSEPLLIAPTRIQTRTSTEMIALADPLVEKALRFARDHLQTLDGVASWAAKTGAHRRSMERAFRTELGQSPLEALTRLRVEHAKELLCQTDLSISAIAEACGFSQADKLSTHFRRITRISPSQFRKQQS